jgi:hypothetical protein
MIRIGLPCALARLGVAAAVLIGAAQAMAAPAITVDISSPGAGYASYNTTQDGVANPDGTFSLAGVVDGATYGTNFNCDWSIVVNPDPQITSTFTLTNLSAVTQTFIMNVTLPIALISPTTVQGGYFGDASTGTTYTDTNGSGNVTLATVGANKFYTALVNGIASQGLGTFTVSAPVSGSVPQQLWGTPIPSAPFGPASTNIRISWQFSLTAGDSVSTKGFFQVEPTPAPEPAAAVLMGLGLAAVAVARRRA